MELSVIISNRGHHENYLSKALTALAMQEFKDFEVILLGLPPTSSVLNLIQPFKKAFKALSLLPAWPLANRAAQLNEAVRRSKADYLVFSEANCIPRKDFLKIHDERKEETFFLSGGHFKLTPAIYRQINEQRIQNQDCFDRKWLKTLGLKSSLRNHFLSKNKIKANILNAFLPGKASWNRHNSSCWKKDLLSIGGFNEYIDDEAVDQDICRRLYRHELHGIKVDFNAICLHLGLPKLQSNIHIPALTQALSPLRKGDPLRSFSKKEALKAKPQMNYHA